MDRSKWEYKKLGEVATFERGLTYSKGDEATLSSKGVLRSNNIDLDTHQLVFDEIKYLNPDFVFPESKKLKKDSIFICMSNGSKAHLGKVAFADKDYDYAFGGFMGMIIPKDIYPRYLFYYFLSDNYRNGLEQIGKGANINNLRFAQLAEFKVPFPSLSDQQRIVAELDCLNEMIAVKQEQLKDFDKLAQSIFYDMFGDPVSNEKGWTVFRLCELCKLSQGLAINSKSKHMLSSKGELPLLRIKDMKDGTREIFVNSRECPPSCIADVDDIIYTRTGTLGLVFTNMRGVLHNNCFKINIDKSLLSKTYFMELVGGDLFKNRIVELAKRSSQPDITHKLFLSQSIILPPLSLQQQFADKISAIEAQKELVKQSIAETQALLDYTMDKYFG